MNEQSHSTDFEELESPLDSAVRAVLAEPMPDESVYRVKARAALLDARTTERGEAGISRRSRHVSVVRYGGVAAAIVVIAFWMLMDRAAERVFADVIQNVKQASSVQFTMTSQFGHQPEIPGKMYIEGDRLRVEQFAGMLIAVADIGQKRTLYLESRRKLAQSVEVDKRFSERFANPVEQLRSVKPKDAERIGEEYLMKRLTQVFRFSKVDLFGIHGKGEMLVWVDPTDELPVKIVIHDPNPKSEFKIQFENFEWNKPLPPELFALTIPDGYQMGTILPTLQPRNSTKPPAQAEIPPAQLAQGILSSDRVPARIVWGVEGKTITAIMRDPETVDALQRKSNELRQWDVVTGTLRWTKNISGASSLGASTTTGRFATVVGFEVQLRAWDTGKVNKTWTSKTNLLPLEFSPDGKTLAAGIAEWGQPSSDADTCGGVQMWDIQLAERETSMADDKPTTSLRYTPDGRYLASSSNAGPIRIWDTQSGKLSRMFPEAGRVDFTSDSKQIACPARTAGPSDSDTVIDVNIYDVQTGRLIKTLSSADHKKKSYTLWITFSPDDRLLAAANWDGTVRIWNVATGDLVNTIADHKGGVLTCVFSPDGKTLATGSEDKQLRLWDVQKLVAP